MYTTINYVMLTFSKKDNLKVYSEKEQTVPIAG